MSDPTPDELLRAALQLGAVWMRKPDEMISRINSCRDRKDKGGWSPESFVLADHIATLEAERDNLLAALHDGHELLRAGVHQLSDLPPDTVLGESGTQAIRELDGARAAIGGMLANYPDHKATAGRVSTQREKVAHWTRKVMVEKRENARLRAALDGLQELAYDGLEHSPHFWRGRIRGAIFATTEGKAGE